MIKVLKPGLATSVQDLGREGGDDEHDSPDAHRASKSLSAVPILAWTGGTR